MNLSRSRHSGLGDREEGDEEGEEEEVMVCLVFLLQRRHGRAALLPALEQLPIEHDVRFPSTPSDRSFRRRHAGMQRSFLKSTQGKPIVRDIVKDIARDIATRRSRFSSFFHLG